MELIDKLEISDTTNNGMLPSASKDVYVKFADQCLNILKNEKRSNVLQR